MEAHIVTHKINPTSNGTKKEKMKTLPSLSHSASSQSPPSLSSVHRSVAASVSVDPRPSRSSRPHRRRVSRSPRCPRSRSSATISSLRAGAGSTSPETEILKIEKKILKKI